MKRRSLFVLIVCALFASCAESHADDWLLGAWRAKNENEDLYFYEGGLLSLWTKGHGEGRGKWEIISKNRLMMTFTLKGRQFTVVGSFEKTDTGLKMTDNNGFSTIYRNVKDSNEYKRLDPRR